MLGRPDGNLAAIYPFKPILEAKVAKRREPVDFRS
jgi:hypothetical protein